MNTTPETPILIDSRLDGRILVATLNRPEQANAFNFALGHDLVRLADVLEASPTVEALILTGSGRLFCAGGDLNGFRESLAGDEATPESFTRFLNELTTHIHGAMHRILSAGPLVVGAVNGAAAGAGLGVVCACDYVFARPGAKLRAGFAGVGIAPDTGTSYFLPRIVGYRKALDLLIGGATVDAETALSLGIYNRLIDAENDDFLKQVVEATARLLEPGRAIRETRRLLKTSETASLREQLDAERETMVQISHDPAVVAQVRKNLGLR